MMPTMRLKSTRWSRLARFARQYLAAEHRVQLVVQPSS